MYLIKRGTIDLAFQGFANRCPVCNVAIDVSSRTALHWIRIYPSKANRVESEEQAKMKRELDDANQKLASLQSKLTTTENTLDSSRQEHGIALSKLESTVNTMTQLKMDNEQLKKSNNDYLSSIEKLKTSYQIVANSFTRSPNATQNPGEQQFSFQDLFKVGKTVLNVVSSDPSNSFVNQTLQRDYLDLKAKYQDVVNREQLAQMKLADLNARLQRSQAAENSQDRQRLQKQLFDALIEQNRLSSTVTNLNLEKQRLLSEKRATQEKYNTMLSDHKKLQDAETTWIANNRHLQELLKASNEDLVKIKALNHDHATEMIGLKEEIKALRETAKKHDAEKIQFADNVKRCEAEIKVLSNRENQLMEKLAAAQQSWQLFL
ncbi:hypothetical protein MBANPS3_003269 [Mucor bainieri]